MANKHEQLARGEEAQQLLKNPLIKEAFETLEADFTTAWIESKGPDHEGRHNAYLMVRLTREIRGYLELIVINGEIARADIERALKLGNTQEKD